LADRKPGGSTVCAADPDFSVKSTPPESAKRILAICPCSTCRTKSENAHSAGSQRWRAT
jgi:hypothetical protein